MPTLIEILDRGLPGPQGPARVLAKGLNIILPTGDEDITLLKAHEDITVTGIDAFLKGVDPEITFHVWFGPTPGDTGTGTELTDGGFTVTGDLTPLSVTDFDNDVIPEGDWVWLTTTAMTGAVNEFHMTLTH